jgi:hypothetical protein
MCVEGNTELAPILYEAHQAPVEPLSYYVAYRVF